MGIDELTIGFPEQENRLAAWKVGAKLDHFARLIGVGIERGDAVGDTKLGARCRGAGENSL
jgi:hypothetical protein